MTACIGCATSHRVSYMRVEHPEFADEEASLRVESTGRADRPFSLADIDLFEPGEVEGEVVDQRGDRVEGARVSAGNASSFLPAGKLTRGVVLSDRDGHSHVARRAPGHGDDHGRFQRVSAAGARAPSR